MKKLEKIFHVLFWVIAFVIWIFWVRERIEIFESFIDQYKNIGYYVSTNDHQLEWYLIISIFRLIFLILIMYFIIPKYGYGRLSIIRSIIFLFLTISVEYVVARVYYYSLSTSNDSLLRLVWDYNFFYVFTAFLCVLILGWSLKSAFSWITEYRNILKSYQEKQSYEKLWDQLNPHFLFNTINGFYDIAIAEGNEKMQHAILNLTTTLRYTIDYSASDTVSLTKEVEAIESYLALQRLRFGDERLDLKSTIQVEHPHAQIAPLILLNYVENAFVHGIENGKDSKVTIKVIEKDYRLNLKIENTDHSQRSKDMGGNEKVKKILELKYPGRHGLKIQKKDKFFILDLWIQLK